MELRKGGEETTVKEKSKVQVWCVCRRFIPDTLVQGITCEINAKNSRRITGKKKESKANNAMNKGKAINVAMNDVVYLLSLL